MKRNASIAAQVAALLATIPNLNVHLVRAIAKAS